MTSLTPATGPSGPDRQLVGEWSVCAIAAAASRFVPVPLLDDAVKLRATQLAVVRTLRAAGREYHSDDVEALYAGVDAGMAGTFRQGLRYVTSVPRRVVLFPVRKYVALFGAVKGVPTDVMQVLLLARTVQRCLAAGRLADLPAEAEGKDGAGRHKEAAGQLAAEAVSVRLAFDQTLDGMDLRLLTGALSDVLSQGKGLTKAAVSFARRTLASHDESAADAPGPEVEAGAERIEEVLQRPEIGRLLVEFDARFDAALPAIG
jgi:hypothetical protein